MPLRKEYEDLCPEYQATKDRIEQAGLSPRARMALRMYAHGAVKSIKEAAEIVGMNSSYLTIIANGTPAKTMLESTQQILDDKAMETSVFLNKLGRRGVEVIAGLMENAGSESLQLKAAVDLADRAPDFSKIQKHQVESFTLSGKDVAALAAAIAEGKEVQHEFKQLTTGNHDHVTPEITDGT